MTRAGRTTGSLADTRDALAFHDSARKPMPAAVTTPAARPASLSGSPLMIGRRMAGGRKRRGEGHTRRDEILQAAKELFLEAGYDATTIRRIADRVGVSAPALYLYFHDKDAIMLALCDQTFGRLLELIADIEKTVGDPLDRMCAFGRAYARFGIEHPDEYRLVFMADHVPEEIRRTGHRTATHDPDRPGAK